MLSYRFTGENPKHLDDVLRNIGSRLRAAGHDVFCSFFLEDYFRKEGMNTSDIYSYCLHEQESCDGFMALIKSEDRSSGMEMELHKANELNQHQVLLIKNDLYFPQFRSTAHTVIEYETLPQLYTILEETNFK
jgi:hypothetical protein